MCGLWASVNITGGREAASRLYHRGPDGEGFECFSCAGARVELAHRRLAIIDLDSRAGQPMSYDDGRYWLVYNGEIYNYVELREELEEAGREFATESDSEVLMAACATWGPEVLPRLTGMFAFALLDRERGELLVARDPFGIKPLYVAVTDAGIAVASEIPPLLDISGVTRRADPERLFRYLRVGITDDGDGTLFADVRQLPAAHYAVVDLREPGRWQPRRYWRPRIRREQWSFAESTDRLRELFLRNVELHLRSDVPVGAALSGGIDSTAIVAGIRRVRGVGEPIKTFSYVAPGDPLDESDWVGIATGATEAESLTVQATPAEMVDDLDSLIRVQGEPFGSTSIYAQYRVMGLAAEHGIKVILDGQGADELFGGYRPFLAARMAELLCRGKPLKAVALLRSIARMPHTAAGRLAVQALGMLAPQAVENLGRRAMGEHVAPPWLNSDWFRGRGVAFSVPSAAAGRDMLMGQLLESLTDNVLPALLRYEDRNSMTFSIESRVPFLTIPMADAAYALPESHVIDDTGLSKSAFRAAMRGIVPDSILDRRDKIGFATPEQRWLGSLSPWVEQVFRDGGDSLGAVCDIERVRGLCREVLRGERRFDFQTWRFVNLIRWSDQFDVCYE